MTRRTGASFADDQTLIIIKGSIFTTLTSHDDIPTIYGGERPCGSKVIPPSASRGNGPPLNWRSGIDLHS